MTKTGKRIALAAATALLGLGANAYAAEEPGLRGGMPMMRGMMFWSMDRNDDGYIDRSELDTFRAKMFENLDSDNNGKLTREELDSRRDSWRHGRRHSDHNRGFRPGRHRGEMFFWFLDRNEDGFVDRAEIDAFRSKRFERLDTNGDGNVSKDEIDARLEARPRYSRHHRGGRGAAFAARIFKRADANSDGNVSRQEYLATEPHFFQRADVDDDGRVSEREARDARMPRGERMFKRADADSDGVVTLGEFMAVEPHMLARADADGDGKISKEEVEAMRGHFRGHRRPQGTE